MFGITVGGVLISMSAELFKAVRQPKLLVRMHTVGLVALAVSVGATAAPFGLIGVAGAVSFSTILIGVYGLMMLAPLLGVGFWTIVRQFRGPAIACVPMGGAMLAFTLLARPAAHATGLAAVLTAAEILMGAVIYLGVLLAIEPHWAGDLKALVSRRHA
jgi:CDP-diglyceride synthetase